jgi:hypothetical protein
MQFSRLKFLNDFRSAPLSMLHSFPQFSLLLRAFPNSKKSGKLTLDEARPPLWGWSAIARQVALTDTASIMVGLAAQRADRPELIRSAKRVLAYSWQAF